MRVNRLHNSAKFGCFSSTDKKAIESLTSVGAFSTKFSMALSAKQLMRSEKSQGNSNSDQLEFLLIA